MSRCRVRMVLAAALVSLAVPATGLAVSSISVAVDSPVVGARVAVAVAMQSDAAGTKRGYAQGRVDDGRPCEPTLSEFTAATPASQSRGLVESIPFAAGTTTVQTRGQPQPGPVRVCGYLVGPSQAALAMSDSVVSFRLPVAALTLAVSPERPVFDQPVDVRVTGTTDVDASIEVFAGAGSCTADPSHASVAVTQGAVDQSIAAIDHPENTDRICVVATPSSVLASPNEARVLATIDRPFSQDLGGSIRLVSARVLWRRAEVVAEVTGTVRPRDVVAIFEKEAKCEGLDALYGGYGDGVRIQGRRVTITRSFNVCAASSPSPRVGLRLTTTRGAEVFTDFVPLDLSDAIRRRFLVVPDVSIGGVRLGMTRDELRRQQGSAPLSTSTALSFVGFSGEGYRFDNVDAGLVGGRVAVIVAVVDDYPFQTAPGLLLRTRLLAPIRRAHPDAACVKGGNARFTPLCRLGRFTYLKTPPKAYPGYFAIGRKVFIPAAKRLPPAR